MKLLKFVTSEVDNEVGGTYEVFDAPVRHVDQDDVNNFTAYCMEKDGVVWYFTLSKEEIVLFRK